MAANYVVPYGNKCFQQNARIISFSIFHISYLKKNKPDNNVSSLGNFFSISKSLDFGHALEADSKNTNETYENLSVFPFWPQDRNLFQNKSNTWNKNKTIKT